MTAQTKFGLLVVMVFLIGMGMLLSRQLNRGGSGAQARHDGMAQLVPERVQPGESSARAPDGRTDGRELARAARTRDAGRTDRDRERGWLEIDHPIALSGLHSPAARIPPVGRTPPPAVPQDRSLVRGEVLTTDLSRPPDRTILGGADSGPPAGLPPPLMDLGLGRIGTTDLPAGWKVHKVAAGETLGAISTKYYQTCRKYDLIFRANRDKLPNPDKVQAGMELRIPMVSAEPAPAPPPTRSPDRPPDRPLDSPLLERVGPGRSPSGAALLANPHPISAPVWTTYRVKEGDTLSSIAADKLGSSRQWRTLWRANQEAIPNPDVLPIGLVLRLPETRLAMQDR